MGKTFTTTIELRFSDFDLYGHVNNVTYFTFLEMARLDMLKGAFKELADNDLYLLVAHAECDYAAPIQFDDRVIVSSTITRLGRSSFEVEYRLHNGNDLTYATARTVMVCFDNGKKCSTAVPECIRMAAMS